MQFARSARAGSLLALCLVATACTREPTQMILPQRGQVTPDEFAILPSKPLETPADLTALPPPTPGAPNRTDVNPQADAVAALGGNPNRVIPDGQLGPDGALIRQTTRYGVDPQIRIDLAKADYDFRSRNRGRLLERWFNVPIYYKTYRREELNQHGVNEYYRQRGVPTVAAPPDPDAQ